MQVTTSGSSQSGLVTQKYATSNSICPQSETPVGSYEVGISNQIEASTSFTYSDSYEVSATTSAEWSVSVEAGVEAGPVSVSVSGSYGQTSSDTKTTTDTTDKQITSTYTTGSEDTLTQYMVCPFGIPNNANCIWKWTAYTSTTWSNAAFTMNAQYYLLGVSQILRRHDE